MHRPPFPFAGPAILALACFAVTAAARAEEPAGYITFAVNVHDWVNPENSGDALVGALAAFEKNHVRGDFYFTEPVARALAEKRPDVIERIRESDMTVSYHIRPPHPLYPGFDRGLRALDDVELKQTLLDYETHRLDLRTGAFDPKEEGGYAYVKRLFGRDPVVASIQNGDQRLRSAALQVLRGLGARMTIAYHESGTDPERPFEAQQGLWIRPSDFSVTRWATENMRKENFWWNMIATTRGAGFDPVERLKRLLGEWQGSRAPFVTALIHENNFYNRGPEAFTAIYWEGEDKSRPARPPYDLSTRGSSQVRPEREQEKILAAYEALVAYAAEHLQVITSEDVVRMAEQKGEAAKGRR